MLRLELSEIDQSGYLGDGNSYDGGNAGANLGGNNLMLDDYIPTTVAARTGELWMSYLNNPAAKPFKIADVVAGQRVQIPYNVEDEVRFYLVSHDPSGKKSQADLNRAKVLDYTPNRETQIPIITPRAAGNAEIIFDVTNFSPLAKFRKILIADDANFTTNLEIKSQGTQNQPGLISSVFLITRTGDLTLAKTKYVKIQHSSNGKVFGDFSQTKTVTFTNAGGTGGSGGGDTPPEIAAPGISGLTSSELTVSGTITNNGGTNPIHLFRDGVDLGAKSAGSFSDTLGANGTYSYKVVQEGAGESAPLSITVASGETSGAPAWNSTVYNEIKRRLELSWIPNGGSGDYTIDISFDYGANYSNLTTAPNSPKNVVLDVQPYDRTALVRISRASNTTEFGISDEIYIPGI